jgi:hypothetical protein
LFSHPEELARAKRLEGCGPKSGLMVLMAVRSIVRRGAMRLLTMRVDDVGR